jgi:hypothetical protein
MTRLRTPALYLLLLSSAACSFHGSYQTGTHTGGTPETQESPKHAREARHYTAPAAHDHADHEVACTSGDEAAKSRCEEAKRRAQEECDTIDRETREREQQAEDDARRQEEEADAEAARQRKQAEEETAQKEREAEGEAAQQPPPERSFQGDGTRGSLARAVDKQKIASGSGDGVAAPRQGQIEAPVPIERRKSDLKESLQRRQNQIDQEAAEKKTRIKKSLGRTKADILVAAQRKRNEVHASLKETAASP